MHSTQFVAIGTDAVHASDVHIRASERPDQLPVGKSIIPLSLTAVCAVSASAVSLGIAMYGGWQRGGTFIEQVTSVALGGVVVLCTHLLPMCWSTFRAMPRATAFVLWCVSVAVVLYGQVSFFMVSQQHASNQRAAAVPATVMPPGASPPSGRSLTEIAQDAAKVSADLARAEMRRCVADCSALKTRKTILAAQLAALDTEASEARRREAEEDRRNDQADRDEALRATLRADPVASTVASWFGTTERRLELFLAVACAVVLEGAAIIGWLLVQIALARTGGRAVVASDRDADAPNREAVVSERQVVLPVCSPATGDRIVPADGRAAVASGQAVTAVENPGGPDTSEDELLLARIHEAVLIGHLKPTQESIRKFLRCRQWTAGSLNRQYLARYGSTPSQGSHIGKNVVEMSLGGASPHALSDVTRVRQQNKIHVPSIAMPAMAYA